MKVLKYCLFNISGAVRQSAIPGVSGLQPAAVVPGQSSSHYYSVPNLLPQTPVQQPHGLNVPQVQTYKPFFCIVSHSDD